LPRCSDLAQLGAPSESPGCYRGGTMPVCPSEARRASPTERTAPWPPTGTVRRRAWRQVPAGALAACVTSESHWPAPDNDASATESQAATALQPRPIKHADIGLGVAPGGPAVAGRRTKAPPRRTGVPAAGEPKIGPGVRFFFDHPVPCRKGCKTLRYFTLGFLSNPTSERNPCREARDGPLWS